MNMNAMIMRMKRLTMTTMNNRTQLTLLPHNFGVADDAGFLPVLSALEYIHLIKQMQTAKRTCGSVQLHGRCWCIGHQHTTEWLDKVKDQKRMHRIDPVAHDKQTEKQMAGKQLGGT